MVPHTFSNRVSLFVDAIIFNRKLLGIQFSGFYLLAKCSLFLFQSLKLYICFSLYFLFLLLNLLFLRNILRLFGSLSFSFLLGLQPFQEGVHKSVCTICLLLLLRFFRRRLLPFLRLRFLARLGRFLNRFFASSGWGFFLLRTPHAGGLGSFVVNRTCSGLHSSHVLFSKFSSHKIYSFG